MFSVQEKEITKYLIYKKYSDGNNIPHCDNKCRPCKDAVEDVQHIVSNCPFMSSRYYLPMQHDIVAKASYNTIIKNRNVKRSLLQQPDRVFKHKNVKHNKLDLVIWNHKNCHCTIIELSCPTDINTGNKINQRIVTYGPLIRNLKMMYEKCIPIITAAMGYVPKTLN